MLGVKCNTCLQVLVVDDDNDGDIVDYDTPRRPSQCNNRIFAFATYRVITKSSPLPIKFNNGV